MTEKVKKNNDVIWSKEQMVNLLHLYEQEIELWDISNPIYSKKDARQRALERVKECLGDTFIGRF
jgi:hypothetical protein